MRLLSLVFHFQAAFLNVVLISGNEFEVSQTLGAGDGRTAFAVSERAAL